MDVTCPVCEARNVDLSPESVARLVDQIHIDPLLRAAAAVYEGRLAVCADCEALREKVLCAYCGCFVLFRARPAKSRCPHPGGDKWIS